MRWFVGGQQALMPELLAMVASTVNSFSRLVPGFWAPTAATWGIENRTCALRVIQGGPKAQRVEYRIAAADIDPYFGDRGGHWLGLVGYRESDRTGQADQRQCLRSETPLAKRQLPTHLERSCRASGQFQSGQVSCSVSSRGRMTQRAANGGAPVPSAVTDWELSRYFEII